MHSISTEAPAGSAETSMVERAGYGAVTMAAVDLVHRAERAEIRQEHRRLEHPVEAAARLLEHGLQVPQHLLGLLGDAALDERARRRVERHLAAREDQVAADDRLRVRRAADGRGGLLGVDALTAASCSCSLFQDGDGLGRGAKPLLGEGGRDQHGLQRRTSEVAQARGGRRARRRLRRTRPRTATASSRRRKRP